MGDDLLAKKWEASGSTVIVAENGYIGSDKGKLFALARSQHSGAGYWPVGEEDRWSRLGVELKPWRKDGRFLLLLPQRGFGPPGVAMPRRWQDNMLQALRRITRRPIRVREHPGRNVANRRTLEADLENCWAAITWASGAGLKAIAAGIPVFYGLPNWIGAAAAKPNLGIESPFLGDRLPMFQRLAWSQWTANEIRTGEPLARLINA